MKRLPKVIAAFLALSVLTAGLWYLSARLGPQRKTNVDIPPSFELLDKEAKKNCDEAKRRHAVLAQRFPNPDAVPNELYFKSREYLDAASWEQACDTATADLEEARHSR